MEPSRAGYGRGMRTLTVLTLILCAALGACLSESGLGDEVREATRALDTLVDQIGELPEVREAADHASETVDEAQAALENFREDPSAEARQALESSARRLEDARERLDGLLEGVPDQVKDGLRAVIDALTDLRRQIQGELEG
jgi:ABC-type transporter Mla subunit MlaD